MVTGLDEFHLHLAQISRVARWVLPTAAFTPVVTSLVGLNPPWPNAVGLTAATCAAVLVTVVAVFQFSDGRRAARVNRLMAIMLALGVTFAAVYFCLFAFFVFKPANGAAFSKGYVCTAEALQVFGARCPWLDIDELKSVAYEESRLWTIQSIVSVKIGLLFSWFGMFMALSAYLGSFTRHQAQRKKRTVSRATG